VDIIWEMRMPMRAQHAAATRSVCVNSQHNSQPVAVHSASNPHCPHTSASASHD